MLYKIFVNKLFLSGLLVSIFFFGSFAISNAAPASSVTKTTKVQKITAKTVPSTITNQALISALRTLLIKGLPEDIKLELRGPQGLQGPPGLPASGGTSGGFAPLAPPSFAPQIQNTGAVIGTSAGFASLGAQEFSTGILRVTGNSTLSGNLTVSGSFTNTSPILVTPNLGTPSTLVGTNITGTAPNFTSGKATNLAGGVGGQITYQSAADTTSFLANGTAGQVLQSSGTTLAPTWINLGGGGDMVLASIQTVTGVKTFGSAGAVGKLIIAGTTSGTTILDATAIAGTGTVTLPTSGTLVSSVTNGNGVSATNTAGALAFTLGAITPTTINGHTFTTGSSTFTGTAAQTYTFPSATSTLLATNGSAASLTSFPTLNQNTTGTAAGLSATLVPASGGTGVANNNASTLTITGNFATTLTVSGITSVTLPTSGTLVSSVTTGNGVSATNTAGALAFTLGAITPTTINGHTFTTGSSTFTGTAAQTYTFPSATSTLLATNGAGTSLTGIPYTLTGTANQVTLSAGTGNITFSLPQSIATGSSPQFATLELGHATDTTLARVSAGVVSIEGVNIVTTSSTDTLTNKSLSIGQVTGLGTNVSTFLITPSSANLISAVTDETGSGVLVFGTSPQFTTAIGVGAAAGTAGIAFPATQAASTGVNVLDDYEEGTWTPTLGGAGGTSGQTYTHRLGTYVKIGKQVTVWFDVRFSAKGTITGNAQIQGLPFTADSVLESPIAIVWHSFVTNKVFVGGIVNLSTTVITLYGIGAATTTLLTNLTTTDFDNNTLIWGSVTYMASS